MADFTVRSDHIDVEQIMRQIRARIRDKRGADYTEAEIRELASVKLDKFLDPRAVRSDLLLHYRQQRRPANEAPVPLYAFDPSIVYTSDRGTPGRILTFIRKLLNPILKLFFNPSPLLHVVHLQTQINDRMNKALVTREEFDALNFEMFNNLVVELTRLGVEVRNLRMQVESFGTRLDFDERRARALEGAVQYKPGAPVARPAQPPPAAASPAPPTPAAPGQPAAAAGQTTTPGDDGDDEDGVDGETGRARRRRRRRGRRRGQGQGDGPFEGQADGSQTADASTPGQPAARDTRDARDPRDADSSRGPARDPRDRDSRSGAPGGYTSSRQTREESHEPADRPARHDAGAWQSGAAETKPVETQPTEPGWTAAAAAIGAAAALPYAATTASSSADSSAAPDAAGETSGAAAWSDAAHDAGTADAAHAADATGHGDDAVSPYGETDQAHDETHGHATHDHTTSGDAHGDTLDVPAAESAVEHYASHLSDALRRDPAAEPAPEPQDYAAEAQSHVGQAHDAGHGTARDEALAGLAADVAEVGDASDLAPIDDIQYEPARDPAESWARTVAIRAAGFEDAPSHVSTPESVLGPSSPADGTTPADPDAAPLAETADTTSEPARRFTRVFDAADAAQAPAGAADSFTAGGADAPADDAASGRTASGDGAARRPDDSEPSRS